MACEDLDLALTIAKAINEIDKEMIYLYDRFKDEFAAKKLNKKLHVKYLRIEIMRIMAISSLDQNQMN